MFTFLVGYFHQVCFCNQFVGIQKLLGQKYFKNESCLWFCYVNVWCKKVIKSVNCDQTWRRPRSGEKSPLKPRDSKTFSATSSSLPHKAKTHNIHPAKEIIVCLHCKRVPCQMIMVLNNDIQTLLWPFDGPFFTICYFPAKSFQQPQQWGQVGQRLNLMLMVRTCPFICK